MPENAVIGLSGEAQGMVSRLRSAGLAVAAWDAGAHFEPGVKTFATLPELMQAVAMPRAIWLVPVGDSRLTLALLQPLLGSGDIIVDCGPAHYRAAQDRARMLAGKEIFLVDAGMAGGDEENGYALTLGGEAQAIEQIKPGLEAIAPGRWLHCGPSGSGYFVRQMQSLMQVGMTQAWTSGLATLKKNEAISVDLQAMAQIWQGNCSLYGGAQALALEFLNDANVPARIATGNPQELAVLRQELAPALNLALAVHYAGQGMSLFQRQIAAMLGGIPPRG